jgi:N utilization substance protein B
LYEAEAKGCPLVELLDELATAPEPYAVALVAGVARHAEEIDALIAAHARHWGIDRLPAVDRQLLRVATYELLEERDVPLAVILDEAVELAQLYSTEESSRFLNGVLSAIAGVTRPEELVGE